MELQKGVVLAQLIFRCIQCECAEANGRDRPDGSRHKHSPEKVRGLYHEPEALVDSVPAICNCRKFIIFNQLDSHAILIVLIIAISCRSS
jgi:hypothetical protein